MMPSIWLMIFFRDFSKVNSLTPIRPGRNKGDSVVTDLRAIQYLSDSTIHFKLDFDHDWSALPLKRGKSALVQAQPTQLYLERRKIQESKYKHLQELKAVLPRDYHSFYDGLPH